MNHEVQRNPLLAILMTGVHPPPDNTEHVTGLITFLKCVYGLPNHAFDLRFRHFAEDENIYEDRDVFGLLADNRYQFYYMTGETPETFNELFLFLSVRPDDDHFLSSKNRVLLFLIWLRNYPTYNILANHFNISVMKAHLIIRSLLPLFVNKMETHIVWPSEAEWRSLSGVWEKLPMAVGAIDGTSHQIYRPQVEPQEQYFSGHRHYHCLHTQIIVDANGIIRHVESGFLGHLNDAQQYRLIRSIGQELPFPDEGCLLLGDKIYPNGGVVMTPYTSSQLLRKPQPERRKCRKLNAIISTYRIRVEHAIAELKTYRCISSVWRHPRCLLSNIVIICAGVVCRRKQLEIIL